MSADLQFKQLIDRVLRCREAEDEAKADTKEVYAELKALGYDKTAAGALVTEIRKREKNPEQFEERNTVLDLYREAYERAGGSLTHTHAREGNNPASSHSVAPPPPGDADTAGEVPPPASSATPSDADVPAFLKKPAPVVLRPNCLRPDLCAGSGREHCWSCRKAMSEVAA